MPTTKTRSSLRSGKTKSTNGGTAKPSSGETSKPENGSEQENSQLEKLFTDSLKDIYWAEKQLTKTLPKMKKAATTDELKFAIEEHLAQTEGHVKRLERVFEMCGKKVQAKKCDAMEGIIKEGDSIVEETQEGTMTRDAGIIMAAQKVEHYEIATYGGLVQLALTMDLDEVAELLDRTLMEEEDTDAQLTDIAEMHINFEAEQEGGEDEWQKENEEQEEEHTMVH